MFGETKHILTYILFPVSTHITPTNIIFGSVFLMKKSIQPILIINTEYFSNYLELINLAKWLKVIAKWLSYKYSYSDGYVTAVFFV